MRHIQSGQPSAASAAPVIGSISPRQLDTLDPIPAPAGAPEAAILAVRAGEHAAVMAEAEDEIKQLLVVTSGTEVKMVVGMARELAAHHAVLPSLMFHLDAWGAIDGIVLCAKAVA